MTPNRVALGLSLVLWSLALFAFMERMEWMRPHLGLVLGEYGVLLGAYLLAAALTLYAGLYWAGRWLGIGDLGRKMDVLEAGLQRDAPHDRELAEALARQRRGEGL